MIGNDRSRNRRGFFGLSAFYVFAEETCLDDLDDLRSGLLDGVHQARDDRRAVLLASVSGNIGA